MFWGHLSKDVMTMSLEGWIQRVELFFYGRGTTEIDPKVIYPTNGLNLTK